MNGTNTATYVSTLIEEARRERIQPAAHIMHVLAERIEAGSITELQTAGDILLEAAERPDRELASHPLPKGFSWCAGCGGATAVLMDDECPQCREHKTSTANEPGSDSQSALAKRQAAHS